jgi:hypothetical protein
MQKVVQVYNHKTTHMQVATHFANNRGIALFRGLESRASVGKVPWRTLYPILHPVILTMNTSCADDAVDLQLIMECSECT